MKLNKNMVKFEKIYEEVDKLCREKFGVEEGGIQLYIEKLDKAKFAPERDDTITRLANYKNIYTSYQTSKESKSRKSAEAPSVTPEDIKWLGEFKTRIAKKKDPISEYLKKARNFARRRKARNVFIAILVIAAVAAAAYFGITALT